MTHAELSKLTRADVARTLDTDASRMSGFVGPWGNCSSGVVVVGGRVVVGRVVGGRVVGGRVVVGRLVVGRLVVGGRVVLTAAVVAVVGDEVAGEVVVGFDVGPLVGTVVGVLVGGAVVTGGAVLGGNVTAAVVVILRAVPLEARVTWVEAGSGSWGGMLVGSTATDSGSSTTVVTGWVVAEVAEGARKSRMMSVTANPATAANVRKARMPVSEI